MLPLDEPLVPEESVPDVPEVVLPVPVVLDDEEPELPRLL